MGARINDPIFPISVKFALVTQDCWATRSAAVLAICAFLRLSVKAWPNSATPKRTRTMIGKANAASIITVPRRLRKSFFMALLPCLRIRLGLERRRRLQIEVAVGEIGEQARRDDGDERPFIKSGDEVDR